MPDLVICNTSPLFYLHQVQHLTLLQQLYGRIVAPQAVVEELETGQEQGEDVPAIRTFDWIEVRPVLVPQLLGLNTDFGPGETQVLALALEKSGCLVIADDWLAREFARIRRLRITGTAGVLLKAKRQGYISAVKPLLSRLIDKGFRLSDKVRDDILTLAEE
jgi:predicted nucleic acid-binding protein